MAAAAVPNFFIIGAPKCGTTSIHAYLTEHPDVCVSRIKEPLYFCGQPISTVGDLGSYLSLFAHCSSAKAVGEASALYLYYDVVPRILRISPSAKFIVAVRNPIDMAISYHNQTLYSYEQAEPDFERAWRASGSDVRMGPNCRDPRLLDYRAICRLGSQLARLLALVDARHVHVVVFDDLCRAPDTVYRDLLRFLELADDGRRDFPQFNARMRHRFPGLGEALLAPPGFLRRVKAGCQARYPVLTKNVGRFLLRLNRAPGNKSDISPRLRAEMAEELRPDIDLLARLLNRKLDHWLETGESRA